jgi:rhodanese-related sulfurtransferase
MSEETDKNSGGPSSEGASRGVNNVDGRDSSGSVQFISVEDVKNITGGKEWQIVDVRTPDEFKEGHIASAVNLPVDQLGTGAVQIIGESRKLIFVCRSGVRAAAAANASAAAGCRDVYVMEGAMDAWEAAGLPVESAGAGVIALQRQVFLIAGVLLITGAGLTLCLKNVLWSIICLWVGVGLFLAGATGKCLMAALLVKLPWNKSGSACKKGGSCGC